MDIARAKRLVAFVVVAATLWSLALVLAAGFWGGEALSTQAARISGALVAATVAAFVVNHLLRFVRWQLMLRAEGYRVPWARSLAIFMAGLALLPTPAKAGVAARSVLLSAEGVPVHVSLAAYFAERLFDLIGLLLLAALLLGAAVPAHRGWLIAVLATAAVVGVLVAPRLGRLARQWSQTRSHALARSVDWTLSFFTDAADMMAGWRLPAFVLIGILANVSTGLFLWWAVGASIDALHAIGILAVSHLSGSLSMLPGGIGGFELAMLAQLTGAGVTRPDALLAVGLVRVVTLWGSVAVGLPLLWLGMTRVTHRAA